MGCGSEMLGEAPEKPYVRKTFQTAHGVSLRVFRAECDRGLCLYKAALPGDAEFFLIRRVDPGDRAHVVFFRDHDQRIPNQEIKEKEKSV